MRHLTVALRLRVSAALREKEESKLLTALRSRISVAIVLWIAVFVHLDWHVGRGHHLRLSLNAPWHWVLGVLACTCAWFYAARRQPGNHPERLMISVIIGLFVGQIIEPWWETVTDDVTFSEVYSSNRWPIFLEFAAAGLAAIGVLMLWSRRRPRTQSSAD